MLGKLMKQEFRATGRIMLPLMLAELLLSVAAGISLESLDRLQDYDFLRVLAVTMLVLFYLGLFAMGVVALVLMIQRFYRNLLCEEGYLSMTLPVSVDEHLWAKLLTALIWFVGVGLLSACSLFVMAAIVTRVGSFTLHISDLQDVFPRIEAASVALYIAEFAVLGILLLSAFCLRCYASMAIGCSAADHKLLFSFLSYLGIGFVVSLVRNAAFFASPDFFFDALSSHGMLGLAILVLLVYNAALYFTARWFLKNRLNLA